jgi:hypothetical protein
MTYDDFVNSVKPYLAEDEIANLKYWRTEGFAAEREGGILLPISKIAEDGQFWVTRVAELRKRIKELEGGEL